MSIRHVHWPKSLLSDREKPVLRVFPDAPGQCEETQRPAGGSFPRVVFDVLERASLPGVTIEFRSSVKVRISIRGRLRNQRSQGGALMPRGWLPSQVRLHSSLLRDRIGGRID